MEEMYANLGSFGQSARTSLSVPGHVSDKAKWRRALRLRTLTVETL
jgi:hypothetical protein